MAHVSPCRYSHLLTLSTLGCGLDIGNCSKLNDRHTLLPPTRRPIYFQWVSNILLILESTFGNSKPLPTYQELSSYFVGRDITPSILSKLSSQKGVTTQTSPCYPLFVLCVYIDRILPFIPQFKFVNGDINVNWLIAPGIPWNVQLVICGNVLRKFFALNQYFPFPIIEKKKRISHHTKQSFFPTMASKKGKP